MSCASQQYSFAGDVAGNPYIYKHFILHESYAMQKLFTRQVKAICKLYASPV